MARTNLFPNIPIFTQEILTIKIITTEAEVLEEEVAAEVAEEVVDICRVEEVEGVEGLVVLQEQTLAPELVTRQGRVLGNKILKIKPKSVILFVTD